MYCILLFSGATTQLWPRPLTVEVYRSRARTYTYPVGLLQTSDQLKAEAATQTTQKMNVHALNWIRTCYPSLYRPKQ
jgi:hypothetical protein